MNVLFLSAKNKLFSKRNNSEQRDRKIPKIVMFVSVVILVVICGLTVYASVHMPSYSFCEGVGRYSLKASDKEDRENFFLQFGYNAKESECFSVIVPSYGEVLDEYNEIQKSHGMNLLPYGDKAAQMYVYEIERAGERMGGCLVVYRGRVVAAHLTQVEYPARITGLAP